MADSKFELRIGPGLKKDVTIFTCCFGFDVCPCPPQLTIFLFAILSMYIILESSLILLVNSSWGFNFSFSFCCSIDLIFFGIVFHSCLVCSRMFFLMWIQCHFGLFSVLKIVLL